MIEFYPGRMLSAKPPTFRLTDHVDKTVLPHQNWSARRVAPPYSDCPGCLEPGFGGPDGRRTEQKTP